MPTISAHVVRKPRKEWGCSTCDKRPGREPHVVMFGSACLGDKPYRIRICLYCASSSSGDTTAFLAAMKFFDDEREAGRKP